MGVGINGWPRTAEGLGRWEHSGQVAITGYGFSDLDRRWDGVSMDKTYGAYAIQALQRTIKDSGLSPDDIDGLMVCPDSAGDSWAAEDRGTPRSYFDPPYDSEDGLTIVTTKWLIEGMKREGTPLNNLTFIDDESSSIGQLTGKAAQAVGEGKAKHLLMLYGMGNVEGRYHLEEGRYSSAGRVWSAPWGVG